MCAFMKTNKKKSKNLASHIEGQATAKCMIHEVKCPVRSCAFPPGQEALEGTLLHIQPAMLRAEHPDSNGTLTSECGTNPPVHVRVTTTEEAAGGQITFLGTALPKATPGVEQKSPMFTPGVANEDLSLATAMSQLATS